MIYGDQLAFFSEQFRNFKCFEMTPNNTSSYSERMNIRTVRGVFQYAKRGELRVQNDTLNDIDVPTFWTRAKLNPIKDFIEFENSVFRITNPSSWVHEGGFFCYVLEELAGNTDTQEQFEHVNLGQDDYD